MSEFSVDWMDAGGARQQTIVKQTDNNPTPGLPVVLLLHGMGGDINHMSAPEISPGYNVDLNFAPPPVIDRGWHDYPNVGIWGIITSPVKAVTGWQPALASFGYTALNYAQREPNGNLAVPVVELDAVVRSVLARFGKRLIFVCHSRGGLLVRLFLQRNRNDVGLLSRIAGIVTLHSPHQGSEVADVAMAIHNAIPVVRAIATGNLLFQALLTYVDFLVSQPAIAELSPTSQIITGLRQAEAVPLPVPIQIHTFGGTRPRLLNLWPSVFDAMSAVPQWAWPPFHWTTTQYDQVAALDGTLVRDLAPEERSGGDVLVTDSRSHLPIEASHHTDALNHAAILWDPAVQNQVRDILRTLVSGAACVSQSVPQAMAPGGRYTVAITMRNTGASTWVSGGNYPFRLGTQNPQDNSIWGFGRRDLPASVAPGAQVSFAFEVTAPATPGAYHFQWRMLQEGVEWFGASSPDVVVQVAQVTSPVNRVSVGPNPVVGGLNLAVTVFLASPAGPAGVTVNVTSSNAAVIPAPASIVVPGGASSATFNVLTRAVAAPVVITLTATGGGGSAAVQVMVNSTSQYPYSTSAAVGGTLL